MARPTDSVAIFAEGSFEEQILELVAYVVRNRSDEERASFTAPFHNALKTADGKKPIQEDETRRKLILSKILADVTGLGEGSDKETEGFFNLLFAHLFSLHTIGSPELDKYLDELLTVLSISLTDRLPIRFRVLSNLFNTIPRTSALRYRVYQTILRIAVETEDLDVLDLSKTRIESWINEWDVSAEEKAAFVKSVADAYGKLDQPTVAYEYQLLYLQTLPLSSPEAAPAAVDTIAFALRLPTVFDFDPLFKLEPIIAVKDHDLFSLLQIFLNNGLQEYTAWESAHGGVLEKYALSSTELNHKIRLLTLAALAFKHVGQNLPYTKIAEAVQIQPSEVEKWTIDAIRAGLVWGKLSQTTQTLHVVRATPRVFEKDQWQTLEKRLVAWKQNLAEVLEVVTNAKRQNGQISA